MIKIWTKEGKEFCCYGNMRVTAATLLGYHSQIALRGRHLRVKRDSGSRRARDGLRISHDCGLQRIHSHREGESPEA